MMKKIISILTALALLCSFATLFASAEKSPSGKPTYKVTIDYGIDEDAEPDFDYVQDGETVTLISNTKNDDDDKYIFIRWSITGDYEIISGTLTSPTLVIKPLGDVKILQVVEKYEEVDKDPDKKPDKKPSKKPQGDKNDSETSPPTGDSIVYILSGLFLVSLMATVVFKKLAK